MGCYPLFACRDWSQLGADLKELEGKLVSVVLVTDPFGAVTEESLQGDFDMCLRYKGHYIVETGASPEKFVTQHHRYYARKSLQAARVEVCEQPGLRLDEWMDLYGILAHRHGLKGIHAFSRAAFEQQLNIPGLVMVRASCGGEPVGMHLWFVQNNIAYSHLAAFSDKGYSLGVSYALYWEAIRHFRGRVKWMDLGAGAGSADDTDGLARFKRGWSNGTRTVYLCGRILDAPAYAGIVERRGLTGSAYFPAYRQGEFG